MRTIDADAIPYVEAVDGDTFEGTGKLYARKEDIDALPTIEERKTGKWERHYSRPNVYADMCWHCSNCGYSTPDNWASKWKFCPNCGARMQEGEDNEQVN